jgi:predicted XRE-type DNA-binding protein
MNDEDDTELVHGSGNVFRDLGLPDADILQAKSLLAAQIIGILDDRKLSVRQAEKLTGFAAADFSRVRNANIGRFTLDRLIRILYALDDNLEITFDVRPKEGSPAHIGAE